MNVFNERVLLNSFMHNTVHIILLFEVVVCGMPVMSKIEHHRNLLAEALLFSVILFGCIAVLLRHRAACSAYLWRCASPLGCLLAVLLVGLMVQSRAKFLQCVQPHITTHCGNFQLLCWPYTAKMQARFTSGCWVSGFLRASKWFACVCDRLCDLCV